MDASISKPTPEALQRQAREAAGRCIALAEAHHHEHGGLLWLRFSAGYCATVRAGQALEAAACD